jgi:hypothetical protein
VCFFIPITNYFSQRLNQFYLRWGVPIFPFSAMGAVALAIVFMIITRLPWLDLRIGFYIDEIGEFLLSFAWIPFAFYNALLPGVKKSI